MREHGYQIEMALSVLSLGIETGWVFSIEALIAGRRRVSLITGMIYIRESNSPALFIHYAGIEVVPFHQHLYEPIMPILAH